MISGVSNEATTAWGDLYPSSPLGGGFQVVNITSSAANIANGNYLVLREPATGNPDPSAAGETVLTPSQLAIIDKQFDDGSPATGSIIANDAAGQCWDTVTKEYNEANKSKVCLAAFKL